MIMRGAAGGIFTFGWVTIGIIRSKIGLALQQGDVAMVNNNDHVYKKIELTGSSTIGSDDAVRKAIAKASSTLRNIHWFEVVESRGLVENGTVARWQVTIKAGFTLEN